MCSGEERGLAKLKFSGSPSLNGERKINKIKTIKTNKFKISLITKREKNLILFSLVCKESLDEDPVS